MSTPNVYRLFSWAMMMFALFAPTGIVAAQSATHLRRSAANQVALSPLPAATSTCAPWLAAPGPSLFLPAMSAVSENDIWAVGTTVTTYAQRGAIVHWDGTQWSVVPSQNPSPTMDQLSGVAAVSATNVWAVGGSISPTSSKNGSDIRPLLEHWNGKRWSLVATPLPGKGYSLHSVTALSSTNVWAVGGAVTGPEPIILHWDGHVWRAVPGAPLGGLGGGLSGVAAVAPNDVWAVGTRSDLYTTTLIEHWDGHRWQVSPLLDLSPSQSNSLMSVTALSASDVWAVGYADTGNPEVVGPLIMHWDGSRWSRVASVASQEGLLDVAAISSRDVWAVGRSLIEHWDGQEWRTAQGPAGGLNALAVVGPDDLWGLGVEFQHRSGPACDAAPASVARVALDNVGIGMDSKGDGFGALLPAGGPDRTVTRNTAGVVSGITGAPPKVVWRDALAAVGAMTADASGDMVYVPSKRGPGGGSVQVVDAVAGRVLRTFPVSAVPSAVALDESRKRLFVAEPAAVQVLNSLSGALIATVPISNPTSLAIDDRTGKVFVATSSLAGPGVYWASSSTSVTVLDATSGAVVSKLSKLGGLLALDVTAGWVFAGYVATVGTTTATWVSVIDASSGALLHTYNLGPDDDAYIHDLAADPATHQVFTGADGGLQALDPTTGRVRILTNEPISSLAVSAKGDRVYVTQVDDTNQYGDPVSPGSVSVFDAESGTRLARETVGFGPDAVTEEARSGRIFVLDAGGMAVIDAGFGTAVASEKISPADPASATPGARWFATGKHNLRGPFLDFWNRNGGRDLLGVPLTEPFIQDGRLDQYTERALLQYVDGQVIAAALGRQLTAGRMFPGSAVTATTKDRLYFAATGHSLSGRFLTFWRARYGAVLLGAPISEVVTEGNGDGSGRRYATQWFENGRLEYHPEQTDPRYSVEVGLVGLQSLHLQSWSAASGRNAAN